MPKKPRTFTRTQVEYLIQYRSGAVWYTVDEEFTAKKDAVNSRTFNTIRMHKEVRILQQVTMRRVCYQPSQAKP